MSVEQEVVTQVSSLDPKIIAAVIGAAVAGGFGFLQYFISGHQQRKLIDHQQRLNREFAITTFSLQETKEKIEKYTAAAITALEEIDTLSDYIATRNFKYHGSNHEIQIKFIRSSAELYSSIDMLSAIGSIENNKRDEIINLFHDVRKKWNSLISLLMRLDEKYIKDAKEHPETVSYKEFDEKEFGLIWNSLGTAMHELNCLARKTLANISSIKANKANSHG